MQSIGDVPNSRADAHGEFIEVDPTNGIVGTVAKATWFNTIQRELAAIIQKFGGVLDPNNDRQLLDTINRITLVRADPRVKGARPVGKIPYYPDILTPSATLAMSVQGDNSLCINPEQFFIWRGVWKINTSDYNLASRTFAFVANATYHLRWRASVGFELKNLQDAHYNPGALLETHTAFDTTYDDVLLARIITSDTNVPTITLLKNQHMLRTVWHSDDIPCWVGLQTNQVYHQTPAQAIYALNWGRCPITHFFGMSGFNLGSQSRTAQASNRHGFGTTATRYTVSLYNAVTAMNAGQVDKTRWHVGISA